jgi:hypothetical protein
MNLFGLTALQWSVLALGMGLACLLFISLALRTKDRATKPFWWAIALVTGATSVSAIVLMLIGITETLKR